MCVVVEGEEGGEGGSKKKLRQANGPSEKSALFYAYNHQVHEFVGHLRRVHPVSYTHLTLPTKRIV